MGREWEEKWEGMLQSECKINIIIIIPILCDMTKMALSMDLAFL